MNHREAYTQRYRAQLTAWEPRVDEIKARAAGLPLEGRHAMQPFLDAIQSRLRVVYVRLNDLGTTPDNAWDRIELLAERAWTEFTMAVGRAEAMLRPSPPNAPDRSPPPPPASSTHPPR